MVCKFVIKFKISGGLTPEEFGVVKTAVKKGITVRSDEPGETLWAWIVKIFSPVFKIELKSVIKNLSGVPPEYSCASWSCIVPEL